MFALQTNHAGSIALEEKGGNGTIEWLLETSEKGQPMFLYTLCEPQYKGLTFRLEVTSTYDRNTMDILTARVNDTVKFVY